MAGSLGLWVSLSWRPKGDVLCGDRYRCRCRYRSVHTYVYIYVDLV